MNDYEFFYRVVAVSINRNWSNPCKYIASVGLDKIVKVWNADLLKKKTSHGGHVSILVKKRRKILFSLTYR